MKQYLSIVVCLLVLNSTFSQSVISKLVNNNPYDSLIVYTYEASQLVEAIQCGNKKPTAIIIKCINNIIVFEKVIADNGNLETIKLRVQPKGKVARPTYNKEISKAIPKTKNSINDLSENIDFVYFSWEEIKVIARNSEKIATSSAKISYDTSIHNGESIEGDYYHTLKIEGDYLNFNSKSQKNYLFPMSIIGTPCPPFWAPRSN